MEARPSHPGRFAPPAPPPGGNGNGNGNLAERLVAVEVELRMVHASVDRLDATVAHLAGVVARLDSEAERRESDRRNDRKTLARIEDSLHRTMDATGQHDIARLNAELAERKESARHWTRYAIATAIGIGIMGLGGGGALLIQAIAKGMFH